MEDIESRDFDLVSREIHIRYHYEKEKVTASTRTFQKPPLVEIGDDAKFNPELTWGYQSVIGAKPPTQLQLFLLLEKLLADEDAILYHVREIEDQVNSLYKTFSLINYRIQRKK